MAATARWADVETTVAAFDLDGTLAGRGSVARFVRQLAGTTGTLRALGSGVVGLCVRRRRVELKTAG